MVRAARYRRFSCRHKKDEVTARIAGVLSSLKERSWARIKDPASELPAASLTGAVVSASAATSHTIQDSMLIVSDQRAMPATAILFARFGKFAELLVVPIDDDDSARSVVRARDVTLQTIKRPGPA